MMPRLARRTFGGVAADLILQAREIEKNVGLAAQFVGDHRRLGRDCRNDSDAHALFLHGLNQRAEVAVA